MLQTRIGPDRAALSRRPPGYDPADVMPGIVHLGLGRFHRADIARYTHDAKEVDPATRE